MEGSKIFWSHSFSFCLSIISIFGVPKIIGHFYQKASLSPWGRWGSGTTERLHFHFSLSCIGEGNGKPLYCSCLENPRDGGAWWAAISGVAQSRTRLKWLSSRSFWCFEFEIFKFLTTIPTHQRGKSKDFQIIERLLFFLRKKWCIINGLSLWVLLNRRVSASVITDEITVCYYFPETRVYFPIKSEPLGFLLWPCKPGPTVLKHENILGQNLYLN